jgi:tripartite-type tricarboxylate transporter receptor subunit TctC
MLARPTVAAVLGAILTIASARADSVAEFYQGKEITLVVGAGPGGGYDIYARLLARHFGRFVPGNPRLTVQNMPGVRSLRAVQYLYELAPRDGSTIAMLSRSAPLIGLLGGSTSVPFDPRKFTWLGSPSSFRDDAHLLMVRADAPVKSIEEACRHDLPPLVLGGSTDGGSANDVPILLRDTIGLHLKQVVGYPDSAALFVAVEHGEVHGRTVDLSTLRSVRPAWLKPDSGLRPLVQFARMSRHPQFPDLPTAREMARNEAARALIEVAELPYALSRPVAAPPSLPPDRARALQDAFLAVHADPQYLSEAAMLQLDISPIGGDEVLAAIDRIASSPPELLEYVRKLFVETKGGG